MAHAIRSIYLIRHQVPLNARILLLKSLELSHLSFSAIFFSILSSKNLKRLNRQINWDIEVCFLRKKYDKARNLLIHAKTLPAELIIAKMSLFTGIWVFIKVLKQNNSKLDKMPKPALEWIRLFVNAYRNGISYHIGFGWVFKKTLNDFLLSQHEKIPLNSNVGAFKSYFYF